MKRSFTFAVGICIFVAASATGKSDHVGNNSAAVTAEAADFGQVSVRNLTAEQRQILQNKFRNWSSSNYAIAKTPL